MRALRPLSVLLSVAASGCGFDLIGRWEIVELTAGGATIEDAGFLDLADEYRTYDSYDTNIFLIRYRYAPVDDAFTPDPTPETRWATMNLEALRDDDVADAQRLELDFPGEPVDLPAALEIIEHTPGTLRMEDPGFGDGAGMTWVMER